MKRTEAASSRNAWYLNLRNPAILLVCAGLAAQPLQAGESPYRPPASYYVCNSTPKANTRYYSAVFPVPGTGVNYQQITGGFEAYISANYGIKRSAFCHGDPDQNKVRSELQKEIAQLKNAKWSITETGWKYSGAGQTAQAQTPSPLRDDLMPSGQYKWPGNVRNGYFVCTAGGRPYVSAVTGPFSGTNGRADAMQYAFAKFVSDNYSKADAAPSICLAYNTEANARAQMKDRAGTRGLLTSWTYSGAASAAGAPSASSNSAPAAGAAQTAAGNADGGMYWICTFSYYSKPYVSDVISPADAPGEAGQVMGKLVQEFTSYLVANYNLKPHVGAGSCIYQTSAAQAQATLHRMMQPGAVATGWKP